MKTAYKIALLLTCLSPASFGQDAGTPDSGLYFMPHVEAESQQSADFDGQPGGLSRSFIGGEVGFKRYMPRNSHLRIYGRFGEHDFDFEGDGRAPGGFTHPFGKIQEEEVGAILLNRLDNNWGYYARLGFVSLRAPDANLISSTEARAMGILGYRFSDNLELGLGFLAKNQISRSPVVYPIPVINYNFSDRLQITTSDQIDLRYSVIPNLTTLILTSNPKRWRMRLDEQSDNAFGIAEYERVPLSLSLDQIVHKNIKVTLTGTLIPYHKLSLENPDGDELDEAELDPAFQFGAKVAFRF